MIKANDYPDVQPITLLPDGKLVRFPSVAKAKMFLLEHNYWRIIPTEKFLKTATLGPTAREEFKNALVSVSGKGTKLTFKNLMAAAELFDPWALSEEAHESNGKARKLTSRVTKAGMKVKVVDLDPKWPKQLCTIVEEMGKTFNDDRWFVDEDVDRLLNKLVGKGLLKTKQPPLRIFKFYRKRMLEAGFLILRADQ